MPPKRIPRNFKSSAKPAAVPKAVSIGETSNSNSAVVESTEENIADRFDEELSWCIHHLKLNLTRNLSQKEGEETLKNLRILENPGANMIKKRSVMRSAFGDYRSKMEEEKKRVPLEVKNAKIAPLPVENQGHFLRKAHHSSEVSNSESGGGFKFNFNIPQD